MKLDNIFAASLRSSQDLEKFYESLSSLRKRRVRSEWRDKVFANSIVPWGKRKGIWRLVSDDIMILGKEGPTSKVALFSEKYFNILYQAELILTFAAVDKLLHEAFLKKFSTLLKDGAVDDYIKNKLTLSDAYKIALESRKRSGRGGKRKNRPANLFKKRLADELYKKTFLRTDELKNLCKKLGKANIFNLYASNKGGRKGSKYYEKEWSSSYKLRNDIVHECLIIRKKRAKKVDIKNISSKKILEHINFVREFGNFLATKL